MNRTAFFPILQATEEALQNATSRERALFSSFRSHFSPGWLSARVPLLSFRSFHLSFPARLTLRRHPRLKQRRRAWNRSRSWLSDLASPPNICGLSASDTASVAILIFNISRQCFVVVKQFRPAVYMCEMEQECPQYFENKTEESWCPLSDFLPASKGITYELCAGIVDKPELSLEEIACEEVLEECGYEVPVTSLKRITSCRSGVGVTGSKQTLFYMQVTDDMKSSAGGGQPEEGEMIEVVEIPLQDSMKFAFDETFPKTMGLIFSFMWFQSNIAPKLLEK